MLSSAVHKPIDELHLDYEIEQEKVLFDDEEPKTASKTHFFEKRLGSMKKPKIMNRIPDDAEASIVLVGEIFTWGRNETFKKLAKTFATLVNDAPGESPARAAFDAG